MLQVGPRKAIFCEMSEELATKTREKSGLKTGDGSSPSNAITGPFSEMRRKRLSMICVAVSFKTAVTSLLESDASLASDADEASSACTDWKTVEGSFP